MKVDHFTYTDLAKAGPLFHPESSIRAMAHQALRYRQQAQFVLDKRDELHSELKSAQADLILRQRMLHEARGFLKRARSLPRVVMTHDAEVHNTAKIRECEVEVGHALDRVWAAQRGVAMWDHVYGELL